MDSLTVQILALAIVFLYGILILLKKKGKFWFFCALLFVVVSVYLRAIIDVEMIRDFRPYFHSFLQVKYDSIPQALLFEPYRLIVFKLVIPFSQFNDLSQMKAIYWIHFVIVTAFFIWLAYLKQITFEIKLILFLAFYPVMAFVWLRAGMAYVASGYLLFTIVDGKKRALHFLPSLIHASSIPFLLAVKIREMSKYKKAVILSVAAVVGFFTLDSSYAQYLFYKFDRYSDSGGQRTSINLLLFNAANIFLLLYLAAISPVFRKNFTVLVLIGSYLMLYYVNPVMGLRVFPFVLIASIVQRIAFRRYQKLTFLVCVGYLPIYFARFDQIFL